MKKSYLLLLILLLISCDDDTKNQEKIEYPYDSFLFDDFDKTEGIVYGSNFTQSGVETSLTFDLYEGQSDSANLRPLVIIAHGGSFFFGSPDDLLPFSSFFARSGYAVAAIRYRLIDVPLVEVSQENIYRAITDAIHDMKASIRFFYKSAQNGNPYRIDTNHILIAGHSAGSVMALHTAYWDKDEETIFIGGDELKNYVDENGGFSGNSGNQDYSEKVQAVINFSGEFMISHLSN